MMMIYKNKKGLVKMNKIKEITFLLILSSFIISSSYVQNNFVQIIPEEIILNCFKHIMLSYSTKWNDVVDFYLNQESFAKEVKKIRLICSTLNRIVQDQSLKDIIEKKYSLLKERNKSELSYISKEFFTKNLVQILDKVYVTNLDLRQAIKLIIEGADINAVNKFECTILLLASGDAPREMIHFLIKAGVNVNAKGMENNTALIKAAKNSNNAVINLLLNKCLSIELDAQEDLFGGTALIWCARSNNKEAVEMLIEAGANINIVDKESKTALDIALSKGYNSIAQLLRNAINNIDR